MSNYNIARAIRLVTLKLVGYAEAIHVLRDRLTPDASIVLFGGLALQRPYPGSTTVSTVNGGVVGLVHCLVTELAPVRVNAIHPGIVGDSPFWEDKDNSHVIARTPLGRLVTMEEIVDAVEFLFFNTGVNGVNLAARRWLAAQVDLTRRGRVGRRERTMYYVTKIDERQSDDSRGLRGSLLGFPPPDPHNSRNRDHPT